MTSSRSSFSFNSIPIYVPRSRQFIKMLKKSDQKDRVKVDRFMKAYFLLKLSEIFYTII